MEKVENPMLHAWRGLMPTDPVESAPRSTERAEAYLMGVALRAFELGDAEDVLLERGKYNVKAKELTTLNMDEDEVFSLIVLAAKSQDKLVRLAAFALIASAARDFALCQVAE